VEGAVGIHQLRQGGGEGGGNEVICSLGIGAVKGGAGNEIEVPGKDVRALVWCGLGEEGTKVGGNEVRACR
jgi:hypothetical protein